MFEQGFIDFIELLNSHNAEYFVLPSLFPQKST